MIKYAVTIILTISCVLYLVVFQAYDHLDAFRFDMLNSVNKFKLDVFSPYNKTSLQKKLKEAPPAWVNQQLNKDFAKGSLVTEKKIDDYLKKLGPDVVKKYGLAKVRIINNDIEIFCPDRPALENRKTALLQTLKLLRIETQLPSISFVICLNNYPPLDWKPEIPIFAFSKHVSKHRRNVILLPDLDNLSNWRHKIVSIYYADKAYKWREKSSQIFWRGQIKSPAREKVIEMAEKYGFMNAKEVFQKEESYVLPELQLKHKYLLSVDGDGPSFTGLLWKLASRSLVVKQDSPFKQWYYGALKPWVHYVPVKTDLKNIKAIFNKMLENDAKMKEIALRSNRFVNEHLTFEDMLTYVNLALNSYLIKCFR